MKAKNWAACAVVGVTVLLFTLAVVAPVEWPSNFLTKLAQRRQELMQAKGAPQFRAPVLRPMPDRYVAATRTLVTKRMAAPDWAGLPLEAKRHFLLETLLLHGADDAYRALPEAQQRQVAEAYLRVFLGPP